MIKVWLFQSGEWLSGGGELIEVWRKDPTSIIWADLSYHHISKHSTNNGENKKGADTGYPVQSTNDKKEEGIFLEATFGLHPLAIQDAQRDRHPPKIEVFDNHTFVLLKGLSADSENIDFKTIQLALFVGERFLVTRHTGTSLSVGRLDERIARGKARDVRDGSTLALQLCRLIVERYLNILLTLEPRLEELEELMLDKANDAMLSELIQYKSDLKRLRRFASYHEQLFKMLKDKSHPGFSHGDRKHEIVDVWEQQERVQSLAQLFYETAADLIDGYISVASHRLNQIMKVLTIVMAVFVPLSFLAGIYGMNFENMPELHSKSGYYILLSVMAFIAALLMMIFRRIKWL